VEESTNLWRIAIGSSGRVVEGSLQRLTHGTGSDVLASADRSGRIAFQVETLTYASWTLPLDSNLGKAIGPVVRQTADAGLVDGRNSVDAMRRLLVYPRVRSTESEIWIKDLRTNDERHLVTTPQSQLNPIISPDATKVAYTIPTDNGTSGYVIPAAGGTTRKICDGCIFQGWLHDSRRITAIMAPSEPRGVLPGGGPRVVLVDVTDTSTSDLIVDLESSVGRADPSPDGRWIAFQSRRRLWVAPLRPGEPPGESLWTAVIEVAPNANERACGWSPDGRLLYLLLERDGFRDLYAQRMDPSLGRPIGEPVIVQHLHDPRRRWGSTPYGTAIVSDAFVFNQSELTGSIWLLQPQTDTGLAQQ
jgi:hypothetical protein